MRLGGERGRGRRPGETILIDARVSVVAHAGERVQVHRQLERGQLGLAADLLGRDLVHGRAQKVVRALGVLGEGRAQEPRVRRVVRTRVGILQPRLVMTVTWSLTDSSGCRIGDSSVSSPGPAASSARGRTPSACTRSRACGPVWPASAPRPLPRESSRPAAAARERRARLSEMSAVAAPSS